MLKSSNQSLIKLSNKIPKTTTEDIATLSKVLIEHDNLNYRQTKMGLLYKKIDETAEHIITKCPKFLQKRH